MPQVPIHDEDGNIIAYADSDIPPEELTKALNGGATKPPEQMTGAWREPALVGSNVAKGLTDFLGTAMNAVPGAAVPMRGGSSAQKMQNMLTSAGQQLGILDRPDLQPQGEGEKYLAAGSRGVGTALPFLVGAGSPTAAASMLTSGGLAGIGDQAGQDALPSHPVVGGALGSILGALSPSGAKTLVNALALGAKNAFGLTPEMAQAGETAQNAGIPVKTSQLLKGSTTPRTVEQEEAFTKAISNTFGEDSKTIDDTVMNNARKRITGRLDDVQNRIGEMPMDQTFFDKLDSIEQNAREALGADSPEFSRLKTQINRLDPRGPAPDVAPGIKVKNTVKGGQTVDAGTNLPAVPGQAPGPHLGTPGTIETPFTSTTTTLPEMAEPAEPKYSISGEGFTRFRAKGSPFERILNGDSSSNVKNFAGDIRNAMDDLMDRQAPPGLREEWQGARQQYRIMKLLEGPVATAQANGGRLNPSTLASAVNQGYKKTAAYGGAGDLGDIANAGKTLLSNPLAKQASGHGLLGSVAAGGLGVAGAELLPDIAHYAMNNFPSAATVPVAAGAALGLAKPAARFFSETPLWRNMLIKDALRPGPAYTNPLIGAYNAQGQASQ